MPFWMQLIIGIAATITAITVIWKVVLKPGANLVTTTEKMLPLLRRLTDVFDENPDAFVVLADIAAQFHSDSGTTLRDVIDRLERASEANTRANESLLTSLEAAKQLSERDRTEIRQLVIKLDRMVVKQATVADNLAAAQNAVDGVAADLAAAHQRADDVPHGDPAGAAADAASKVSKTDEAT